jgi:mevalonate pyrophosphate decarboxylase
MNVQQINTALVTGSFTNDELTSVIDAVKFARSRLTQQARFTLRAGSQVKFHSAKRNMTLQGTITKVAQKYATINTTQGLWKVPMNMLEAV